MKISKNITKVTKTIEVDENQYTLVLNEKEAIQLRMILGLISGADNFSDKLYYDLRTLGLEYKPAKNLYSGQIKYEG